MSGGGRGKCMGGRRRTLSERMTIGRRKSAVAYCSLAAAGVGDNSIDMSAASSSIRRSGRLL